MLYYRIDVLQTFKDKGITTYDIQVKHGINGRIYREIKAGKICGTKTLDRLCGLLEMQPGEIIGWQPDPKTPEEPEYYI